MLCVDIFEERLSKISSVSPLFIEITFEVTSSAPDKYIDAELISEFIFMGLFVCEKTIETAVIQKNKIIDFFIIFNIK
jgi:hypothetical protein